MTSLQQPQAQEECDFFHDTPQKAKEEPKQSQLVVDTKLKQTEAQHHAPISAISASTAGSAQTQSVQVSEKVVEKVTSSNVAEVRSELHNLHNKIDAILGRNRSLSPTSYHKVSYKSSSPVETIKKSYALTNVPLTTSVYSTESSLHVKKNTSLDSFDTVALKARAVARAKEYLLGVSNKTKSTYETSYSTSDVSKYFYAKPVDIKSSSLYKSSILTSTPTVSTVTQVVEVPRYIITETHTAYREKVIPIEVPTYKTYTFYKPARLVDDYQYQPEKVLYTSNYTTSYKPVTYTSSVYSTSAYELPKSSAIRTEKFNSSIREEREVKSRAPQVEEHEERASEMRSSGKRRVILDDRKQRGELVRKTPYEQSNRDQVTKERAQEILKQDEKQIKDFDFKKNTGSKQY